MDDHTNCLVPLAWVFSTIIWEEIKKKHTLDNFWGAYLHDFFFKSHVVVFNT